MGCATPPISGLGVGIGLLHPGQCSRIGVAAKSWSVQLQGIAQSEPTRDCVLGLSLSGGQGLATLVREEVGINVRHRA